MCGGGGGGNNDAANQRRHEQQMALQREQMAEQKRQFELQLAQQNARYEEQRAAADAPLPPRPNPIAETSARSNPTAQASSMPPEARFISQVTGPAAAISQAIARDSSPQTVGSALEIPFVNPAVGQQIGVPQAAQTNATAATPPVIEPTPQGVDPLYAPNQSAGGRQPAPQGLAIAPRSQRSGMGRRRFRTSVAGGAGGLSIPG